jgi:hypothetical protein
MLHPPASRFSPESPSAGGQPPSRRNQAIPESAGASLDAFWRRAIPPHGTSIAPRLQFPTGSDHPVTSGSGMVAMTRTEALGGAFSIDWSPIIRIVTTPCTIYINLSFGNHLCERLQIGGRLHDRPITEGCGRDSPNHWGNIARMSHPLPFSDRNPISRSSSLKGDAPPKTGVGLWSPPPLVVSPQLPPATPQRGVYVASALFWEGRTPSPGHPEAFMGNFCILPRGEGPGASVPPLNCPLPSSS